MFCPKCGAAADAGARFCRQCGSSVGDEPAWVAQVEGPVANLPDSLRPLNVPQQGTTSPAPVITVIQQVQIPTPVAANASGKSPGVALLLSLLICGAGQLYNGEVAKGILMFIGCAVLWTLTLGWIISIWSMIDAYGTAKRLSSHVVYTGGSQIAGR